MPTKTTIEEKATGEGTPQEKSDKISSIPTISSSTKKWECNGFGKVITNPSTGKFSKEESAAVKQSIESFCSARSVSPTILCNSEFDGRNDENCRGAWCAIAQCLPQRTVKSVYRHGTRIAHPFKMGAWSKEETDMLIDLVRENGKKWAYIQNKLNRSSESCRDKFRDVEVSGNNGDSSGHSDDDGSDEQKDDSEELKEQKGKIKRKQWTKEEGDKLIQCVRDAVKSQLLKLKHEERLLNMHREETKDSKKESEDNINDYVENMSIVQLRQTIQDKNLKVSWLDIRKELGNRTRIGCIKRFLLLVELESKSPVSPAKSVADGTTDDKNASGKKQKHTEKKQKDSSLKRQEHSGAEEEHSKKKQKKRHVDTIEPVLSEIDSTDDEADIEGVKAASGKKRKHIGQKQKDPSKKQEHSAVKKKHMNKKQKQRAIVPSESNITSHNDVDKRDGKATSGRKRTNPGRKRKTLQSGKKKKVSLESRSATKISPKKGGSLSETETEVSASPKSAARNTKRVRI